MNTRIEFSVNWWSCSSLKQGNLPCLKGHSVIQAASFYDINKYRCAIVDVHLRTIILYNSIIKGPFCDPQPHPPIFHQES